MAKEKLNFENIPQQIKFSLQALQVLSSIEYNTFMRAVNTLDGTETNQFFKDLEKDKKPANIIKVVNASRPAIKVALYCPGNKAVELAIISKSLTSGTQTKTITVYPYKTLENGEENILASSRQTHADGTTLPTDNLKFVYKKDMIGNIEAKSYYTENADDTEKE